MHIKADKPLYKFVIEETLDQLSSGVLQVGHRFPPESDYAAELGVSRHTLRQAFSELEQSGVIKRRKRGGTEVIALKPVQRFSVRPVGFYNALGVISETLFDLTDVSVVDGKDYADLRDYPSESSEWVCCTGSRTMLNQSTPFCWSRVFVSHQFSGIKVQAGDSPTSIYQLIQNRYGETMNRVKQRYSAELCTDEVGNTLGIKPHSPVLTHVAELFNGKGALLVLADSRYDPTRFTLKTEVNVVD